MPIYEYACLECGREFEELVRGDERPTCPACGKDHLERRMSAPAGHVSSEGASCPAAGACPQSHCCGPSCGLHH